MDDINWTILVVVALAALAIGAAIAWLFLRRQASVRLKRRFGPEYDHAVAEIGDQSAAEGELRRREKRVKDYAISPLSEDERRRTAQEWRSVQSDFVDAPDRAVASADLLVERVMEMRGYPMANFEERAADVSVDHPQVVENYRRAHALALRSERGEANTEELRQAMVHYRALFEELIEEKVSNGLHHQEKLEEVKQ